jgi:hypothetical protein
VCKTLSHLTRVAVAFLWCIAHPASVAAEPRAAGLRLLPENPRYFEFNGLPLVLFMHKGGLQQMPYPNQRSRDAVIQASRYGNHFYMPAHPAWVRATAEEVYRQLLDDTHWRTVREIAEAGHRHGVLVHLFFWSYKFNYEKQDWTGSDMVWADPAADGGLFVTTARLTRRDVHELAIARVLAATWDFPNVIYNFMWEYNVRYKRQDPEGAFHRWWAQRVRQVGRRLNPDIEHRISVKLGHVPPSHVGADFVVEEDGNGFWYNHSHRQVLDYKVPAVFISSDFVFADNSFTRWEDVTHSPRRWTHGQVVGHPITPDDVRAMVLEGFHPAETWVAAREDTLNYYLQARWYMENAGVVAAPGSAVRELPAYRPSRRPQLANPPGFVSGRKRGEYAAIYRHPDGTPPAQAEVWIDLNHDGRFSPDPAQGERFAMSARGTDYIGGVLFTTTGPANCRYVFRFADQNWNPPGPRWPAAR